MAEEVSADPDPREMDMLLSTGERISCALCAMAINDLGHRAISLTGSQAGIVTDASHTKARILDVRADRIRAALDEDSIVLVAGFQGVSTHQATSRRSAAADRTRPPSRSRPRCARERVRDLHRRRGRLQRRSADRPEARKLERSPSRRCSRWRPRAPACCSCARSSTPATTACGSTVAPRSTTQPGTVVVGEAETMEQPLITAVTHSTSEARVTLAGVPDEPGAAARIFEALARGERERRHDRPERAGLGGRTGRDLLHGPARRPAVARAALAAARRRGLRRDARRSEEMGKVSIVGAGMRSHPGVAAKVFGVLAEEGINIEMISTSPIKISCVIARDAGGAGRARAAQRLRALRSRHDRRRGALRRARRDQRGHRLIWRAAEGPLLAGPAGVDGEESKREEKPCAESACSLGRSAKSDSYEGEAS